VLQARLEAAESGIIPRTVEQRGADPHVATRGVHS
jgi:hypothetical protein